MMKKILIVLLLAFTVKNYSQGITVNTTTYTVQQLINNILINSPCVTISNVNYKTGTSFGSTNGIGYFENTNDNFPFSSGVVLTTGDVTKTPSPNTAILSDGNTAWGGDTDLEFNLLSQSGIAINSINASFIEFDFQPKTSNFNFSFLFASEEYGTAQCSFSDAFTFLLRDVTAGGPNQNLAVIPATNLPISVETIRDDAYNTNCSSANPELFGSFNGTGFGPAINFNGQTVEMVAAATRLDTNHIYRIKIVIADGNDNVEYDSAIFLKANSFNLGQNVLGPDYSIENNTAICPGDPLPVLTTVGLDPLTTTFVWEKAGVAFSPPETGSILDLNRVEPSIAPGKHTFSVTYILPGCSGITDEITIEIYPKIGAIANVPNIYTCDISSPTYSFDLTKNTSIIMAGSNPATSTSGLLDDLPQGTIITYHSSDTDAKNNSNPLSSPHTISSSESGKTIWVRIQSTILPCYEIRSFQLFIVPPPTIMTSPRDLNACARNTTESPPRANFDLTQNINKILGSQDPVYNLISFHPSQTDANNNTNKLFPNSSNILLSPTRTIWVRLGNSSDSSCFATAPFTLTVIPIPEVDILEDVFVCDYYILPSLSKAGAQYWSGPNGTGIQHYAGDKIDASTTIYVFNKSLDGGCTNEDSFDITIVANLESVAPKTETYCTQYVLPPLGYGKYFTMSGGTDIPGNTVIEPGTTLTSSGTFYVWFTDTTKTPSCKIERSFDITIIPFEPLPSFEDKFDCNSYTLPSLTSGEYRNAASDGGDIIPPGTIISETQTIYVYKQSGTSPLNCISQKQFTVFIGLGSINPPVDTESCSSYPLPDLAFGEYRTASAGGGSLVPEGTVLDETTQLWFYIPGQTCTNDISFTITIKIKPLPIFENSTHCDIYYLPTIAHTGNYYTGPLGTGILRKVGYPITKTQTLYFYDKATSGPCYVQAKFVITIYKSAPVDAKPREVIKCGSSYILDDLKKGEYYEFPGGPSPTNPILRPGTVLTSSKTIYVYAAPTLPNYCVSEYSIDIKITLVNKISDIYSCDSYTLPPIIGQGDYYTASGGPHGGGTKISPPYTTPITTYTKLYVYAEDSSRVSCSDEDAFNITIYNSPIIAPITPITTCTSYELPPYTSPVSRYFTKSGGPGNGNVEKFPGDIITSSTTIYAYAETGTSTTKICTDEKPINITILPKLAPIFDVPPICTDFITGEITNSVIISGYSLPRYAVEWKKEDGTIVSTLDYLSTNEAGNYTLTVTDLLISGCVSDPTPFTVIQSSKPDSVNFTTSGWFTDSQTIVVNAVPNFGNGNNFLYSLDSNPPQTSNTFTNVSAGTHEITISDANGCSSVLKITLKTIYAPKYFSPNGDGFNETWNIMGLGVQDNPKLYIFDRYGKFLKQLQPDGPGWDGIYNGQPLPASDYWFTLTYQENGISKEYKSHFSLIR